MLAESRYFKPSDLSLMKDIEGLLDHLKYPLFMTVFGFGFILKLSFTVVWSYLPFYLQGDPFHLSLEAISYMFLAYSLGVIGSPLAGWLAGNFGLKRVRIIGVVVLSIGIFLTLFSSLTMIVIGLC